MLPASITGRPSALSPPPRTAGSVRTIPRRAARRAETAGGPPTRQPGPRVRGARPARVRAARPGPAAAGRGLRQPSRRIRGENVGGRPDAARLEGGSAARRRLRRGAGALTVSPRVSSASFRVRPAGRPLSVR